MNDDELASKVVKAMQPNLFDGTYQDILSKFPWSTPAGDARATHQMIAVKTAEMRQIIATIRAIEKESTCDVES